MPLSRQRVGTYPETSSHATCQGTFSHSPLRSLSHCGLILAKSGMSMRELISTLKKERRIRKKKRKKKESAGGEGIVEHSPKILVGEEKAIIVIITESDQLLSLPHLLSSKICPHHSFTL